MSRCRSFDGIILKSSINQRALSTNPHILDYSNNQNENTLTLRLEEEKKRYQKELLLKLFDVKLAVQIIQELFKDFTKNSASFNKSTLNFIQTISSIFFELEININRIKIEIQQNCTTENLNLHKDFFLSKIKIFEEETVKIPIISNDEDIAETFVSKILKCCEELEWRKYVLEHIENDFSSDKILYHKQMFFKNLRKIENNSKFYIKLSEKLKSIYTEITDTEANEYLNLF